MFGRVQQNNNVCRFYQQGRCKFGNACKYDHPGANNAPQSNQNSFAALSNNQNNSNAGRPGGPTRGDQFRAGDARPLPYLLSKDAIKADLETEKPQWPFSAYGPGRDAPRQLFGGYPLEQSFEEMRVMHYLAESQGNVQAAIQSEQELLQQSSSQVQQVLADIDGAIQYVLAGKDEHPNRLDMCQKPAPGMQAPQQTPLSSMAPSTPAQPSAFGAPSMPGAFGRPSALGGASAFGQPSAINQGSAFGQPSAPGAGGGGFGQPSALGAKPAWGQPSATNQTSAFGQPSAPAQASAFGRPSAPAQSTAFGQPSAPGQPSAFGQPSAPGRGNAFGRPAFGQSSFSQPSAVNRQQSPFASAATQPGNASAFGQSSQPASQASPFATAAATTNQQSGGFGATSTFGQPSAFGQPSTTGTTQHASPFSQAPANTASPFARPQNADSTGSAFGQPSGLGQQPATNSPSPFGAPAAQTQQRPNPFGQPQPTQATQPTFGQPSAPSPFGQTSQPQAPSGFGQPSNTSNPSPFATSTQPTTQSPFAQPQQQQSNGTTPHTARPSGPLTSPDPSTYTTRTANNTLATWKGAPVQYIENLPYAQSRNGTLERIWHPNGPPAPNADLEAEPEVYDAALEMAYAFVRATGTFKDGIMPEVPPKREWIRFDV